uniref:Uncharacterized protein n=1 Tax=Rhizophagus irregularis (strain DAOM 181602 / DAOM 197198 / MUCL 43194) TaxID=747089 RepID=U9U6G4_RHIID
MQLFILYATVQAQNFFRHATIPLVIIRSFRICKTEGISLDTLALSFITPISPEPSEVPSAIAPVKVQVTTTLVQWIAADDDSSTFLWSIYSLKLSPI